MDWQQIAEQLAHHLQLTLAVLAVEIKDIKQRPDWYNATAALSDYHKLKHSNLNAEHASREQRLEAVCKSIKPQTIIEDGCMGEQRAQIWAMHCTPKELEVLSAPSVLALTQL